MQQLGVGQPQYIGKEQTQHTWKLRSGLCQKCKYESCLTTSVVPKLCDLYYIDRSIYRKMDHVRYYNYIV